MERPVRVAASVAVRRPVRFVVVLCGVCWLRVIIAAPAALAVMRVGVIGVSLFGLWVCGECVEEYYYDGGV